MHDGVKQQSVSKVLQGQCYHYIDRIPGLWKETVGVGHLSNVLVSEQGPEHQLPNSKSLVFYASVRSLFCMFRLHSKTSLLVKVPVNIPVIPSKIPQHRLHENESKTTLFAS